MSRKETRKQVNNYFSERDHLLIEPDRLSGVIFSSLLVLVLAAACSQPANARPNLPRGIQLQKIDVNGVQRSYYLHIPPGYQSEKKLPLVLILHGGGRGDGLAPEKYTGFTSLADREGFIAVYPNGIDGHWNDGRGVTYRGASDTSIDDVGFISRLIDHLVKIYKADAARVYVTGLSNGGMMTLRLGCELASRLAAIAPVIANIPRNIIGSCRPDSPLPVLLMNGTDDPLVPYTGGYVRFLRRKMGEVVSTSETVSFWVKRNHCSTVPSVRELPDRDPNDHSRVKVTAYNNQNNGNDVILYTIEGGGHTLPGGNMPDRPRLLGRKNNDIDGAAVIWAFFRKHSR